MECIPVLHPDTYLGTVWRDTITDMIGTVTAVEYSIVKYNLVGKVTVLLEFGKNGCLVKEWFDLPRLVRVESE